MICDHVQFTVVSNRTPPSGLTPTKNRIQILSLFKCLIKCFAINNCINHFPNLFRNLFRTKLMHEI